MFKMNRLGADARRIEACLVGAGNVLQDKHDKVCSNLIASVSDILDGHSIKVVARALGGMLRRCMFINIGSAEVHYSEGDGPDRLLYRWEYNSGEANE